MFLCRVTETETDIEDRKMPQMAIKIHLNCVPWLEKILKLYLSQMAILPLNYPPWLEKTWTWKNFRQDFFPDFCYKLLLQTFIPDFSPNQPGTH